MEDLFCSDCFYFTLQRSIRRIKKISEILQLLDNKTKKLVTKARFDAMKFFTKSITLKNILVITWLVIQGIILNLNLLLQKLSFNDILNTCVLVIDARLWNESGVAVTPEIL